MERLVRRAHIWATLFSPELHRKNVTTTESPKQIAHERAQQLLDALRAEPDHAAKAVAIEEAEYLQRAIHAFHMEAVRFRSYTLSRMLAQADSGFSEAARTSYLQLKDALESIGLATR